MKSLSRKFLVSVGLMSLVMTVLGTLGAFVVFQQELYRRQVAYLEEYVRERSSNLDRRFTTLRGLHEAAAVELARRMDHLTATDATALADRYFPLRADGTRRSRPEYFDGAMRDGVYIYGMGAYVRDAASTPPHQMKALAAAFDLVSSFGQAAHRSYDNFYFFTPETRLVMFGPDRPDRLSFYRETAPPDVDISREQMSRLTQTDVNLDAVTRCTSLQRLVQDESGERLATACVTPVLINGRRIGAFGSSLDLRSFFQRAVEQALPGATNLVVTDLGELIAYPGFSLPGRASDREVARYEQRLHLKRVVQRIKAGRRTTGVTVSPDGREIIAFARLQGPDWYMLLTYPKAQVASSAARSASWVLLVGGVASLIQTLLLLALTRRTVARPLRRLAMSCEPEAFGVLERPDVQAEARRADEIGVLARALAHERATSEAVLASLEDRVRERTAELERANAEKSRFLANMSHELRTPLNGVIAISESLAKEQTRKRPRELAELIVSSGRLLERVLTDILDFSKIEAGQIQLASDDFDLVVLVSRIAELHRAAAESKGLTLAWRVDEAARGAYRGDAVRLTQVLSNLLSNAVKFTERGEIELEVSAASAGMVFAVTDTGIGFDEHVRARLFRRFEQADDSIRRRFGGTGLGLAISRSLVELMGGRIEASSRPGAGSRFEVVLPLPRAAGSDLPPASEAAVEADLQGRRVLLAEDHPTNQKVIQLILEAVGVELTVVENGAQALATLAAEAFDAVLMDMQMPELDGLAATAQLRAREVAENLPRTPVIMLTANALDDHMRASAEAGADLHLSKPIRAATLMQSLAEVIAGVSQPGDAPAQVRSG